MGKKIALKKELIYASIAFGATELLLSALADWIQEISLDLGPSWVCAKELVHGAKRLLNGVKGHLAVKQSFSGPSTRKSKALAKKTQDLCCELVTLLDEVEDIINGDISKEAAPNKAILRNKSIGKFYPKTLLHKVGGRKALKRCLEASEKLEDLKNRTASLLPSALRV